MDLPDGLTSRPLTLDDAAAVTDVIRAEEAADVGEPETTLADVQGDWQRPTYDLASSAVGVVDGDAVVAYAEVVGDGEVYTAVHPDHRGRGIGTALAGWARETARSKGYGLVASQVPVGGPADRLMTDLGHEASVVGVARIYADLAATLVIDDADAPLAPAVEAEGLRAIATPTVMSTPAVAAALATTVLNAAGVEMWTR
jgi:GNAT superfamily N-acetyltransferase